MVDDDDDDALRDNEIIRLLDRPLNIIKMESED